MSSQRLRGQAWVVFDEISSATAAIRAMQGFDFFNKPMVSQMLLKPLLAAKLPKGLLPKREAELQRVSYAKTKSDATAKLEGNWNEQVKEKRKEESAAARGDFHCDLCGLLLVFPIGCFSLQLASQAQVGLASTAEQHFNRTKAKAAAAPAGGPGMMVRMTATALPYRIHHPMDPLYIKYNQVHCTTAKHGM